MNCVSVDISRADKKTAHAVIAKKLGFPEYCGGNLDALHDALYDRALRETVRLRLYVREEQTGFEKVFRDVAGKCASLKLRVLTVC